MDVVQVNPISGLSRVEPPEEQLSLQKMQLYVSIVTVQALHASWSSWMPALYPPWKTIFEHASHPEVDYSHLSSINFIL